MSGYSVRFFLSGKEIASRSLPSVPNIKDFVVLKRVLDKPVSYFLVDRVLYVEDDEQHMMRLVEVSETDSTGQVLIRR